MRVFIIIVLILISLLYLQYYTKYKNDYQILQVYLDKFKLNTLYEKYPIVIYDQIANPEDLLKTVFAYSFVFKKEFTVEQEQIHRNSHKYVLLYSEDDILIKIINPKYKKDIKTSLSESDVQYITVKLKEKQVLILPALWYYHTENIGIYAIGLDDLITKWFYKVY